MEEKVYDFLSPNNFYQTETDAESAVNAIYSRLASSESGDISFHRAAWMIGDFPGESSSAQTSTVPYRLAFEFFTWTPNTDGIEFVWQFFYQVIFRTNIAIERIPLIKDGDQNKLKRLEGEARLVRALSYLYLIRLFENVPFTISSEEKDRNLPNMGNTDLIFDQIIEDFKFAESVLPVSYSGNDVGRATKGAAQTLLAKTYLTMAGYPWNKTENYSLAASKLEEIIKSGTYDLVPDYGNNFKEVGEHNKEYIFDVEFHSNLNGSNWVNMTCIRDQNVCRQFSGWSSTGGTKNFYNDMITLQPEDKRIPVNFILQFKDVVSGDIKVWGEDYDQNMGLVHTWKYTDPDETGSSDQNSNINFHFTRYADVLLMHSEAVNNASGFSGSYDKYYGINKVRERAGLAPLVNLDKDAFNKSLIWERVCELCFESHVWYDYKRMNCMEERVARKGIDIGTSKKYYVFPIPVNELDRNPNLEQHPLWK
ncbi:MAG: RagB/SusD family nutrient uptake outer membrane protein [Tannerella sp.]|nr:RagB/SusD family nutrient uptake outer membrane protein [Tannerella sp.]